MGRFTGFLGLFTMMALAFIFSTNRRAIRFKTVAWGLGLQFALGIFVIRVHAGEWLFAKAGYWAKHLLDFSYYGSAFIFGELGKQQSSLGLIFAFQVLPTSIFMGQTEAPLTIRPFLPELTQSELMTVMTSGMAHISGGMMAAYIAVGGADAKNLLTAVIMTAPGTLLVSKMLIPEVEQPLTAGRVEMPHLEKESNILGAIARGTLDGL